MSIAISAILLLVGLLNFYPVIGAAGAARLSALYGLPIEKPDMAILMRHRALLFGLGDARLNLRQRAFGIEYDLKILAPGLIAKPRDPRRLARFVRCTA